MSEEDIISSYKAKLRVNHVRQETNYENINFKKSIKSDHKRIKNIKGNQNKAIHINIREKKE